MSKKFKGKPCAYCTEGISTSTGDHIFAREFFLPEDRSYLPKVPACQNYNNRKSKLETYLTAVLPFGGRHSKAEPNLKDMVPKRLDKNAILQRTLRERRGVWAAEDAQGAPYSTLPIDPTQVLQLFEFIVKGLAFHHFGVHLSRDVEIEVRAASGTGREFIDDLLQTEAVMVQENPGQGTFSDEGAQSIGCAQATAWRIETYGGLQFMDSRTGAVSSCIEARSRLSASK
jgi:hypothetical protein